MKITFRFHWGKSAKEIRRAFKSSAFFESFSDYLGRVRDRNYPAVAECKQEVTVGARESHWICHPAGKILSSEEIAEKFEKHLGDGKNLVISIGGDEGFSEKDLKGANLIWSFGKLTLPHELAAVVAAEQVYRAISILKGEPYHRS